MNEQFTCRCGGETVILSETIVRHRCNNKHTTDVIGKQPAYYDRVQIDPTLTDGVIKYNWWLRW